MKRKRQIFLLIFIALIMGSAWYFLLSNNSNKANFVHSAYQYSSLKVDESSYDIAKVTSEKVGSIVFYYKNHENQKFSTINNLINQKEELIFATNGGIFSKTYEPLGLYIENGITVSELNRNTGEGNFYFQPNGVFYIKDNAAKIIETRKYQDESNTSYAIQSGPLLVIENKINSSFSPNSENKYLRSGVGIDQGGNVIFAISNQPVTFYEFASLFKDKLNCSNALYLDGAISEMYIPKYREKTEEQFSVIIGIVEK